MRVAGSRGTFLNVTIRVGARDSAGGTRVGTIPDREQIGRLGMVAGCVREYSNLIALLYKNNIGFDFPRLFLHSSIVH